MNIVCPKCFKKNEQIVYTCHTPQCGRLELPQPQEDTVRDENGKNPRCAECGAGLSTRLCPECGYPLPDTQGIPYLPFLITGASGCGKSCYLSLLIHHIRHDMCKYFGTSLYPVGGDPTIQLYDRLYHHPLFVQNRCPSPTETEDVDPLGYSLVFPEQKPAGKTCNLTLYDSCGETFESEKTALRHNQGLALSKGIFLLVDPSQLPGSKEYLLSQGKPVLDLDIIPLLSRIIHILRSSGEYKNVQRKIDIPIAICLTKLDTIEHLLDPSSFVCGPSRHMRDAGLNKNDWETCNLEVQSIIESWGGRELVNQIWTQFSNYGFFAFSSLGSQPEDSHIHRLSSHRVLDPFLWMLWQNNIISAK